MENDRYDGVSLGRMRDRKPKLKRGTRDAKHDSGDEYPFGVRKSSNAIKQTRNLL